MNQQRTSPDQEAMAHLTCLNFGSLLLTPEHGSEVQALIILDLLALIFSREGDRVVLCSKEYQDCRLREIYRSWAYMPCSFL